MCQTSIRKILGQKLCCWSARSQGFNNLIHLTITVLHGVYVVLNWIQSELLRCINCSLHIQRSFSFFSSVSNLISLRKYKTFLLSFAWIQKKNVCSNLFWVNMQCVCTYAFLLLQIFIFVLCSVAKTKFCCITSLFTPDNAWTQVWVYKIKIEECISKRL